MIRSAVVPSRILLAIMAIAASMNYAVAAPLIGRVPSSAAVFGSIDFDAVRKSPLGGAAASAAAFNEEAGRVTAFLTKAGIDPHRDLSELVFAILPHQGDAPDDMAILASGKFDQAKLRAAAIAEGGKEAKVGSISALRMPKDGEDGLPLFLSFVDGIAVMGSAEATKVVHSAPKGSSPARRPSDVPAGSAFWFAGDLGRIDAARDATASVPAASKVQRVLLWALLSDAVELHAIADATEAAAATQIAGFAQVAAGFAAMSQDAELGALLSGLRVSAQDRRVTASLKLSKDQIARLREADAAAVPAAPASPAPSKAPAAAITPAK